ncbi:MAG TPA: bifunctional DNA-formamidopyrimidine glycosylase/DNA-(apurinic or apyrimidinic site) lyase [Nocardioidaceae bacterium]|nr:bifunctional DNA-formamidopyrimidine glycosylase/DNA-(apurinic or apyrimidinic site) lyase [Nocardioidaceae bacterium]
MPELPEVEVVRRGLERHVVGRVVTGVTVLHARSVRRHRGGAADFAARLAGRQVLAARRRGKYLWLPLDSGDALLGHLGMSGQFLHRSRAAAPERNLRVAMALSDGSELRFVDQRTFGGLSVSAGGSELPAEIAHIARDPVDALFDDQSFVAALRRRRTGLKRALLDQTLVSGVGNIYADEALWAARLHYARPTDTARRHEVERLLAEVRAVMGRALAQGGTSFDALYVNIDGESGYFERSLAVYGRAGQPCPRCGRPVRRDAFMNRSSYTCPGCQPRPRRARW